jgi:hypothetical protein
VETGKKKNEGNDDKEEVSNNKLNEKQEKSLKQFFDSEP